MSCRASAIAEAFFVYRRIRARTKDLLYTKKYALEKSPATHVAEVCKGPRGERRGKASRSEPTARVVANPPRALANPFAKRRG